MGPVLGGIQMRARSYAWVSDGVVKQDEREINGIQEQGYSRDLRRV